MKPAAVAASPLAPTQLAAPEVIPLPVTAAATAADTAKKAPVIETPIPIPASSIRFPTVSTPIAVPAVAVPAVAVPAAAAVTAVQIPDTAIKSPVAPVAGKESMMREMLLKKRQGGAMGGKL